MNVLSHWFAFLAGAVIALSGLATAAAEGEITKGDPFAAAGSGLIVHEWGVLWLGRSGGNPIIGSTDSYLNALPKWVLRNQIKAPNIFTQQLELLIIDKPVIHFYGAEGQPVEVTVKVAQGFPIVYYPEPELTRKKLNTVNENGQFGTLDFAQSMTWKFRLTKKTPGGLLTAPPDHWWNATRRIPSDYLVMENEKDAERFVFYEGTTSERPSVTASVAEGSITFHNTDSAPSDPVILIINDNGTRSGIYIDSIRSNSGLATAANRIKPWDEEELIAHCRKQWEACGMTPEEAKGIVESWRPELLNTPGFLFISAIPDRIYDGIFPIEVKPEPAELTRACLVFDTLSGQDERKRWLPRLRKKAESLMEKLAAEDFKERLKAHAEMVATGESLSPFVREFLERENIDPQSKMAATTIQNILAESPVCAHRQPKEVQNPHSGFVPLKGGRLGGLIPVVPVPPK